MLRAALLLAITALPASGCSVLFDGNDLHGTHNPDLLGAPDLGSVLDLLGVDAKPGEDIKGHTGCTPATKISFAPTYIPTGGNPGVVVPGDFNSDGKVDFAVLAENDDTVSVYLSNGDGTFTPGAGSPIGVCAKTDSTATIAAGHFSAASSGLDVVVGCADDSGSTVGMPQTLFVLPGDGSGGFGSAVNGPLLVNSVVSLAVADFDGDGNDDLAIASEDGDSKFYLQIALQSARGKLILAPALTTSGELTALAAGDLNGDGAADLVVPRDSSNNISLYLSDRKTTPVSWPSSSLTGPAALSAYNATVADLDGDALPDLVIDDDNAGNADVFLQSAAKTFSTTPGTYATGGSIAYASAVADFDCDGHADIAVSSPANDSVAVLRGNGKGAFAVPAADTESVFGAAGFFVADLNGDGLPDMVVGGQAGPAVQVTILMNTSK